MAILQGPLDQGALASTLIALVKGKENPGEDRQASQRPDLSVLADRRILLVEDHLINQQVAHDMFGAVGLVADVANDGREALFMTESRRYDLILMDMQMPVMGGIDATRAIRRLPGYADVAIIAMTANVTESDKAACLEAGMNDHLGKPVTPDALYAILHRWLPASEGRAAVAATEQALSVPTTGVASIDLHIPDITGLNVEFGVRNALGNRDRYRQLLVKLIQAHEHDSALIEENLRKGKISEARIAAHSLKGAAATLGAEDIFRAAAAIEAHLKATPPTSPETELPVLGEAIQRLKAALQL